MSKSTCPPSWRTAASAPVRIILPVTADLFSSIILEPCNFQKRSLKHREDERRDAAASMKHYERYIGGPSLSAVQIRSTSCTCLHVMRRLWVLMKFSIALAGIKTAAAICGDGGGLTTPPLALIRPAKERKLTEHILEGTILPRNVQYFHTGGAKQLAKFSTKCNIRRGKSFREEFHHACVWNCLLMQRDRIMPFYSNTDDALDLQVSDCQSVLPSGARFRARLDEVPALSLTACHYCGRKNGRKRERCVFWSHRLSR